MFGLGRVSGLNRKEYNTRVKDILERTLGIQTDHSRNARFPAIFAFADLIAQGWYTESSPEDTALDISLRYVVGGLKAGGDALEEARSLSEAVLAFLTESALAGKISHHRARAMVAYYDEHSWRLAEPPSFTSDAPVEAKTAIVNCPACGQSARVPFGKKLRIKCPRCAQSWVQDTSNSKSSAKPVNPAQVNAGKRQAGWDITRPERS